MHTPRLRLYTKNISYLRMAQGALGLDGNASEATERLIASSLGVRHAILVSMGRMAIYEGLRALPTRGEIILSPITVPEVISLVVLAGFTPVFCDVAHGTWNMDPDKVEELITPKTVAIMTTHFYGNTNTTAAIRALCDKHKLPMIEDAAQALGARFNGKAVGTIGDFGILSFSYPKNVTSFYGGCLITNNDQIASKVRQAISDYPKTDPIWLHKKVFESAIKDIATWGPLFQMVGPLIQYGYAHNVKAIVGAVTQDLNASLLTEVPAPYLTRLSPAQARALADKWPEIDEDVQHRIKCAEIYHQRLQGMNSLTLPVFTADASHTYLYFPVQVEDKYALQRHMIAHGCDVAVQHAANCADLPAYKPWYRDCPNARAAFAGTVMLPSYRGFPLEQARRYADAVRSFFNS